jgi:hypothetical protein
VDEREWLAGTDLQRMLEVLQEKASERKLRLLACAVCRRLPGFLESQPDREGLELTERDVDGLAREEDVAALPEGDWDIRWYRRYGWDALERAINSYWSYLWDSGSLHATTEQAQAEAHRQSDADMAVFVREVFGNPFRPPPPIASSLLTWEGGLIKRLAEAAYEHRTMPAGTLDPHRLAVLADALEDAGADAPLVAHLREAGPHYRGCHALDALLQKA